MTLLLAIGRRLAAPFHKSVRQHSQRQKIDEPASAGSAGSQGGCGAIRGAEIRPRHGNVRAAAVRQFHKQHQLPAACQPSEHRQSPSLKGMTRARNRHRCRKILVMGSLTTVPSTASRTSG
jgi:hypothetical protein